MRLAFTQDQIDKIAARDPRLAAEISQTVRFDELQEKRAACAGRGGLINFIRLMWHVVEPSRPLVEGWVLDAICLHLEAVTFGDINRLLINVPPGTSKSLCSSVFYPAWEWGPMKMASMRYMCAAYAAHLTRRDNIRFRRLILSKEYRELWGDVFGPSTDQFNTISVGNDKTGWKLATSVGGTGTGERADRVICLPAEEQVLTDRGYRPIGEIVGQRLDVKIAGYDGRQIVWQNITKYQENPPGRLVRIRLTEGGELRVTEGHRVYTVSRGKVEARLLNPGDRLHGLAPRMVSVVEPIDGIEPVTFNLTVDPCHNYFAGDGILVANCDDANNPLESESSAVVETTTLWFTEVIPDRLNHLEKSAIINIQQRTNEADISGIILSKELDYTHLCYDASTEVLSEVGWVRFEDLAPGVAVLGVDPETLHARWETPTAHVAYPYDGEMIHYRSAVADLMVTPDHRMVYCDTNDWRPAEGPGVWRVKAANLLPSHFYLAQAVVWGGTDRPILFGGYYWDPDVFAEFMGWYLSEGCASAKSCSARIVQKERDKADVIRELLARTPCADRVIESGYGNIGMRVWAIYGKELATALAEFGNSRQKHAPRVLLDLSSEHLERFILSYACGDGGVAGRNGNGIRISSRSKIMIDQLQECCAKIGWAATWHVEEVPERFFNDHTMPGGLMYHVYIRRTKMYGKPRKWYAKIRSCNVEKEHYSGMVYCVSVPSTAILVRRNGRVAVSGNCVPMEYDPNRHCVTSIGWEDPRGLDDDGYPLSYEQREAQRGTLAWPERFSPQALKDLYAVKGPFAIAGQYQQAPVPRGGGIFQRDWIEPWPGWNPDGTFRADQVVRGRIQPPALEYVCGWVDTAFTDKQENDFCAMVVLGVFRAEGKGQIERRADGVYVRVADELGFPKVIVLHAWKKRLTIHGPPEEIPPSVDYKEWRESPRYRDQRMAQWGLVEWVADTVGRFKIDYLGIETQAAGHTLEQELYRLHSDLPCTIELIPARGDKVARGYAVQGSFSSRQIYFPTNEDGSYPTWLTPLADDLFVFPKGQHDDLVDALTGGVKHLRDNFLFERRESWEAEEERSMEWGRNKPVALPYDL